MNSLFFFSFLIWFILTTKDIYNTWGITQSQRKAYFDVFNVVAALFCLMLILELVAYSYIKNYFQSLTIFFLIFLNIVLIFSIKKGDRENNKTIRAKQENNFNLKPKKVQKFKEYIKTETNNDLEYYHFKTVHKKSDLTVDAVKLNNQTSAEYNFFFTKELGKDFEDHLIYKKLIEYYNDNGKKYGLEKVSYKKISDLAVSKNKKRYQIEFIITDLYLRLIDKKISIRISQLLQYSNDKKYLSNYIYFLMCLESKKFVPKSILYAILYLKRGKIK